MSPKSSSLRPLPESAAALAKRCDLCDGADFEADRPARSPRPAPGDVRLPAAAGWCATSRSPATDSSTATTPTEYRQDYHGEVSPSTGRRAARGETASGSPRSLDGLPGRGLGSRDSARASAARSKRSSLPGMRQRESTPESGSPIYAQRILKADVRVVPAVRFASGDRSTTWSCWFT